MASWSLDVEKALMPLTWEGSVAGRFVGSLGVLGGKVEGPRVELSC